MAESLERMSDAYSHPSSSWCKKVVMVVGKSRQLRSIVRSRRVDIDFVSSDIINRVFSGRHIQCGC